MISHLGIADHREQFREVIRGYRDWFSRHERDSGRIWGLAEGEWLLLPRPGASGETDERKRHYREQSLLHDDTSGDGDHHRHWSVIINLVSAGGLIVDSG